MGFTPNLLTILAIVLSLCLGYKASEANTNDSYYLYVALGLLFRMMLNALDGMMARIYNLQSTTGEILNEVGDIVSDVAIYPLLLIEELDFGLAFGFIILSILMSLVGVG